MFHRTSEVRQERGERGASLVEYALLVALIAVVCISAVTYFGSANKGGLGNSAECFSLAYSDQDVSDCG